MQPNFYKVCVFREWDEEYIRRFVGPDAPMVVEFTSGYQEAPPPDPQLLALHATSARVAHMSGAAEFLDRLQWDAEETKVLVFDGYLPAYPATSYLLLLSFMGLGDRVNWDFCRFTGCVELLKRGLFRNRVALTRHTCETLVQHFVSNKNGISTRLLVSPS